MLLQSQGLRHPGKPYKELALGYLGYVGQAIDKQVVKYAVQHGMIVCVEPAVFFVLGNNLLGQCRKVA